MKSYSLLTQDQHIFQLKVTILAEPRRNRPSDFLPRPQVPKIGG